MNTRIELCARDVEFLFRPFVHRKLRLPTRIVLAAMSRGLCPGGLPSPELIRSYCERAEAGVGLVMTESLAVSPCATGDPDHPEIYSGPALRRWRLAVRAVHACGSCIAPQLWHTGELRSGGSRNRRPRGLALSPSGVDPVTLLTVSEPMSRARIADVIEAFARAALRTKALGFDAVALHGAHGFLIDQFLWEATNRRQDEYGGSPAGRVRFARELVAAVRKAVGSRFPIILRLSPWKIGHPLAKLAQTPAELADIVQPLAEAGVDIFDCSTQDFARPEFEGSPRGFAGWVKRLTGRPVIAVGGVGFSYAATDRERRRAIQTRMRLLLQLMQAGEFDLIAVGRALLADAEWAAKVRRGDWSDIIPWHR